MNIYEQRRQRLARQLGQMGLGAVAIVPGPSFYYLTGLHFLLLARPTMIVVTSGGELLALLPELERLKWFESYPGAPTFLWQDGEGFKSAFDSLLGVIGQARIGIESRRMRAFEADEFRDRLGPDAVVDVERVLERQRMVKDAGEIASMRKAIAVTELALAETLAQIRVGDSELDVRRRLSIHLLEAGAEGLGFEPLVMFGSNSANPHGTSGDRPLRAGDPILIDCSARIGGYHSALSCSAFCGHVTDEHAEIHETVVQASIAGRDSARVGITAHELNDAVLDHLRKSRFSDLIVHRGGHGIGLAIQELPHIQEFDHEPLVEGTVVLLEPALYRRGDIGVRLEDMVLLHEDGPLTLTSFPRKPHIVGK